MFVLAAPASTTEPLHTLQQDDVRGGYKQLDFKFISTLIDVLKVGNISVSYVHGYHSQCCCFLVYIAGHSLLFGLVKQTRTSFGCLARTFGPIGRDLKVIEPKMLQCFL